MLPNIRLIYFSRFLLVYMLLYNFTTHVRRICNIAPHYAMRLCIQIGINLIAVDLLLYFLNQASQYMMHMSGK